MMLTIFHRTTDVSAMRAVRVTLAPAFLEYAGVLSNGVNFVLQWLVEKFAG